MDSQFVDQLKFLVQNKLGRQIMSSSDCNLLANDIFKVTGVKISINTLRRLFHLMKSKYQPSLFTLDILSKYCNYSSYSDFITSMPLKPLPKYSPLEINLLNLLLNIAREVQIPGAGESSSYPVEKVIKDSLSRWPECLAFFEQQLSKKKLSNGVHLKHVFPEEISVSSWRTVSGFPVDS
jgi:hypothetical protein